MLHPGDRVLNAIVQREYLVIKLSQNHATCKSLDESGEYITAALDVTTLEPVSDSGWTVVSCPHAVVGPPALDVLFSTSVYYAGVIGSMSHRLEDTHQCAVQALAALQAGNTGMASYRLEWVQQRIEETANYLASKSGPDGAMDMSYLRDRLYQNRK